MDWEGWFNSVNNLLGLRLLAVGSLGLSYLRIAQLRSRGFNINLVHVDGRLLFKGVFASVNRGSTYGEVVSL
ncbi:MAG: hypothetical protein QXT96_06220 [Candidatus Bathyarchaeia archaeon]